MSASIESYALVGDCRSAALVGRDGSVDWLCWPRFDWDACFAALLGTPANGRWLICPTDDPKAVSRRYRKDALILETRFTTASGTATVIDFMVPHGYCWIRDSTFTRLALMDAGFFDEAAVWRDWLLRAAAGAPASMQIMYGIMSERRLTEWQVDWLPGYLDSRPVRCGNAAHPQFQLDVYGELMDSFDQARAGGLAATASGWALQLELVRHVAQKWREPDYGIWETRGPPRHFTFSKVMAWVTFDRAIRAVEQHGLSGDAPEWRRIRDAIHVEVCLHGFDAKANTFRAAYDATTLDASLHLLVQVGFLDGTDPRFAGTVAAVERELLIDGFVMRYDTGREPDGLQPSEGAFLGCRFWLADAYITLGRRAEAQALFERLVGLANDVGLLAEEFDLSRRCHVGNFPQAFSHVALINTAFNSTHEKHPSEQRAGKQGVVSHRPLGRGT